MITMSPGLEFRAENLSDIDQECFTVHWTIQQPGGAQAVMSQSRNEGGSLPVAIRHFRQTTFPDLRTPIKACHLGVEARLIDKDQSLNRPASLLLLPALAGGLEVLPVLLGGAQRFFYS